MMIELRTYDGDAQEISRFVQEVWRTTYQGVMPIPVWDERYFDWQLLAERPGGRDYLVAAYDGTRLVGTLFGEQFRFKLNGGEIDATMGSWLTVHPDYRRAGLGTKLFEEQRRRHLEHGAVFHLGYGYKGVAASVGPAFWNSFPDNTLILGSVGFWGRALDHRAVARWETKFIDRWGARFLRFFQESHPEPPDFEGIRPYVPQDLSACLDLAHHLLDRVDLGYIWTRERLAHQLQYDDMPRTIVLERDGRVAAFLNYYRLDFLGRCPIEAAMIDLVAFGDVLHRDRKKLLRAAMHQMVEEGIKMAIALRLPCYPKRPFFATGFIPMPRDFWLICVRMDTSVPLEGVRRLHVHWR